MVRLQTSDMSLRRMQVKLLSYALSGKSETHTL